MKKNSLFSPGFIIITLQFFIIITITALFFAFSAYLQKLGISPGTAGIIISADAMAGFFIQLIIAPLIHPGNVRPWLFTGSLLFAFSIFMVGQVTSIPFLITARLFQGTGFVCVMTSLMAILVQLIPKNMSGSAFGYLSLVRLLPYALIPLLFTTTGMGDYPFGKILTFASLAAILPILLVVFPIAGMSAQDKSVPSPGFSGMYDSVCSRPMFLLLFSALLIFCGYSIVFFYIKQFGAFAGVANAGLFFTVATSGMILVRLAGTWLFDRYNKSLVCAGSLIAVAISYGLLPFSSPHQFFILAAICGLGWGIVMPLQAAVMFDVSTPNARAMNQNLAVAMMQGGFLMGPSLGGYLISAFGYTPLFMGLALLTTIAAAMMVTVKTPRT